MLDELATLFAVSAAMLATALAWPLHLVRDLLGG